MSDMGTMVRTQVQLTREQAQGLKRLAETQGVSMAEIIRGCVEERLRQPEGLTQEEIKQRLMAIAGGFHGPSDLAERHDDYAAEAYRQ